MNTMSTVTSDDVRGLAQLSNIQLSDSEVDSLKIDIENILAYVDTLGELDTGDIEPTYQVNGLQNVFREDEVDQGSVSRDSLLALAPESLDHQVKVPKVL